MLRPFHIASIALTLLLAGCTQKPAPATAADLAAQEAEVRQFLTHVEDSFNSGNFDEFMKVFASDAIQLSPNEPDTVGADAIRKAYETALATMDIKVKFHTDEIVVSGPYAFERGTYELDIRNRVDGAQVAKVINRHIHILKKQADGQWQTWRMMTNSAAPLLTK
jgi:ketosteroid isomerase-like protein